MGCPYANESQLLHWNWTVTTGQLAMNSPSDMYFFALYPVQYSSSTFNLSSQVFNISDPTFVDASKSTASKRSHNIAIGVGVGIGIPALIATAVFVWYRLSQTGRIAWHAREREALPEAVNGKASTIPLETAEEEAKGRHLPEATGPGPQPDSTTKIAELSPETLWSAELEGDGATFAELESSQKHQPAASGARDNPHNDAAAT